MVTIDLHIVGQDGVLYDVRKRENFILVVRLKQS